MKIFTNFLNNVSNISLNKKSIKFRKKSINIIPLIDIIFLLLIFFMLATNFKQNKFVDFSTPQDNVSSDRDSKDQLIIYMKDKGNFELKKSLIYSKTMLKSKILSEWNEDKYYNVMIIPEEKSQVQELISLLDLVKSLGIKKVNFKNPSK